MIDENPYSTKLSIGANNAVDPELLRLTAMALAAARASPPTIASTLLKWPGTPLLVLMGVLGTAILWGLSVVGNLPLHLPIGFAAMIFGAFLRDIGMARQISRGWPAQSHFIEWQKVDDSHKRI